MRGQIATLIESAVNLSVEVNGLFFPFRASPKILSNFVSPLLFHYEFLPETSISYYGSATKLFFNGYYLLACTKHQILDAQPETVVLINPDSGNAVTSNATVFPTVGASSNSPSDLQVFDFSDAVNEGALSKFGWWRVSRHDLVREKRESICVALGFPTARANVDYNGDRPNLTWAPSAIWGEPKGMTLKSYMGYEIEPSLDYDPDGLSGGAVFELIDEAIGYRIRLGGIASNGSRSMMNYIPTQVLLPYLNQAVGEDQSS